MRIIATLKPEDIDASSPKFDYHSFKHRQAARAVIYDEDSRIALIYVEKHAYYMLPGGGTDGDIQAGLHQEILEELGCEIEVKRELGAVKAFFDRWNTIQTDHGFIAKALNKNTKVSPTEFELLEEHSVIWADNIVDAIKIIESAKPINRDGKLIQARDLLFLKYGQDFFANINL